MAIVARKAYCFDFDFFMGLIQFAQFIVRT